MKRVAYFLIAVIIVLGVLGFSLKQNSQTDTTPGVMVTSTVGTSPTVEPGIGQDNPTTLIGEFVCLPHKDTTGPQTEECAYGLKTHPDVWYGLNVENLNSDQKTQFKAGDRVRVTGLLKLVNEIVPGQWEKYNIQGVINVTQISFDR